MSNQKIHSKKEYQKRRKQLRNNLTPAEAYLLTNLKNRKLDNKRFTKQHSIGHYIVDFFCASEKLIVELDGEVHNNLEAQEYDYKRTTYLELKGYKVIRFENKMVFDLLPSVLKEIRNHFDSGNQ